MNIKEYLDNEKIIILGNDPMLGEIKWEIIETKEHNGKAGVLSAMCYNNIPNKLVCFNIFEEDGAELKVTNCDSTADIGGMHVNYLADAMNLISRYNRKNPFTFKTISDIPDWFKK